MKRDCVRWAVAVPLLLLMPASALGQTDEEIEDLFWRSVECQSRLQVQAYLQEFPEGRYVAEARACLEGQLGLDQAERRFVQQGLATLDYSAGVVDGLFGPATRRTIRAWQEAKGFVATGYLTREQAGTLIALGQEAAVEQATAQQVAREEAAVLAREADDAAYAEAQRVNTAAAYGEDMASYPSGRHV